MNFVSGEPASHHGADTIVIQEYTRRDGDRVEVEKPSARNRHIRAQGLDFKLGDTLLAAGHRLTARDLALAVQHRRAVVHVVKQLLINGGREADAPQAFARLARLHSVQPSFGLQTHGRNHSSDRRLVGANPPHFDRLVGLQHARQGKAAAISANGRRLGSL